MSELRDLLLQAVKENVKKTVTGTVIAVDKKNSTCDVKPLNGEAEYLDVKLKAVIDGNDLGLVLFPEVGSSVIVAIVEDKATDAFVAQYSEIESCLMVVGKKFKLFLNQGGRLEVDADQVVFNGGKNGGLINIISLVAKVNQLEQKVDSIVANIKKPPALGVPVDPVTQPIIVHTQRKELEDTKITH